MGKVKSPIIAGRQWYLSCGRRARLPEESHEEELDNRDKPVHDASQTFAVGGWIATTRTDQTSDCQRASAALFVLVPKTFVVNSLRSHYTKAPRSALWSCYIKCNKGGANCKLENDPRAC
jgi:hypothetical protein